MIYPILLFVIVAAIAAITGQKPLVVASVVVYLLAAMLHVVSMVIRGTSKYGIYGPTAGARRNSGRFTVMATITFLTWWLFWIPGYSDLVLKVLGIPKTKG